MEDVKRQQVPEPMLITYDLLTCAFPDGIEPEAYDALLYLLHEEGYMSFRAIAEIISIYTDSNYAGVYADAMGVISPGYTPSAEEIDTVRQRLLPCGYSNWLKQTIP